MKMIKLQIIKEMNINADYMRKETKSKEVKN